MFRRDVFDLDVLDSPIISPTPLSVGGLGIPGSALAERIFNDPEAWTTDNDADSEEGEEIFRQDVIRFGGLERSSQDDPLAWLAEEIEKFQARSAGSQEVFVNNTEEDDDQTPELKQFEDKYRLTPRESTYNWGTKWEGVKEEEDMKQPISLTSLFVTKDEFSNDVQKHLAKILDERDAGALFRSFPSPPHSSGSNNSEASSSSTSPARLIVNVGTNGDADTPVTPIISPVAVHSASTTLSFLEWYGIYPDSPQLERVIRKSIQVPKKGQKPNTQLPSMPDSPSPKPAAYSPHDLNKIGKLEIPQDETPSVTDTVKPPSRRTSPIPPPGLSQSLEERAPTPMVLPSLPKPPTSTLPPAPPPLYRRSPSPCSNSRSDTPERRRALPSDSPLPFRTPTKSVTVSIETPVRRLPLVPGNTPSPHAPALRTATPPSSQKVVLQTPPPHTSSLPPTRTATPTSCSGPSTPGSVPRKCSAPCVGIRSPPAGPMGPRSRSVVRSSSSSSFCEEPGMVRSMSGQRRPPALKFESTPELKI
ncbi:hypothetical protein BDQ17DRAFT_1354048 [Cyathus striatus]|nr:hypothetical protein BDQ17DRAFT_1354048 [Cyathus striatus]